MTVRTVAPAEALALMNDDRHVYVDVRSVPEFEAGHPTGAYNVPLMHRTDRGMQPNPDFLRVVRAAFDAETPIIVGCKMGGRSKRAAAMLKDSGFLNVLDQRAGFEGPRDASGALLEPGWQPADLPTSSTAIEGRSWQALLEQAG